MVVYFRQLFLIFIGGYSACVIPASSFLLLADIARALFPPAIYEFFDGGYSVRVIPASIFFVGGYSARVIPASNL